MKSNCQNISLGTYVSLSWDTGHCPRFLPGASAQSRSSCLAWKSHAPLMAAKLAATVQGHLPLAWSRCRVTWSSFCSSAELVRLC